VKKSMEIMISRSMGESMIKSQNIQSDSEKGFTLTEVMIAAAMSTAIIAAGFGALTVSQKTTQASSQVGNTQATARNALDMIAADIKLAGFGMQGLMGVPPLPATATLGAVGNCQMNGTPAAIVPGDNNPLGGDFGPDTISLVVPMTNSITAAGALWQVAAGGAGLIGGTGPGASIANIPLPANATTAMGDAIPGGVLALTGMAVSINGTAGSRIAGTTPTQINVNPAILGAQFGNGAQVYLVQCITYEIVPPPDALNLCQGNAPCLVRGVGVVGAPNTPPRCNALGNACIPIMDGVEDLQLAYACDGCDPRVNSGIPDAQLDDLDLSNGFNQADFITDRNWFGNAAPYGTNMQPKTIRMVQISVVARETRTEQGMGEGNQVMVHGGPIPIVSDHNHATGVFALGDNATPAQQLAYQQFRRRILTRTVELRNQR
jgi:type IV pilus assembly protein PilW